MYIIKTTEKRPTLAVYEYIIDANNEKEAISKFKNGDYEKVEHLKDLETLENTEIEISTVKEIA
jgi:hypothetical protein